MSVNCGYPLKLVKNEESTLFIISKKSNAADGLWLPAYETISVLVGFLPVLILSLSLPQVHVFWWEFPAAAIFYPSTRRPTHLTSPAPQTQPGGPALHSATGCGTFILLWSWMEASHAGESRELAILWHINKHRETNCWPEHCSDDDPGLNKLCVDRMSVEWVGFALHGCRYIFIATGFIKFCHLFMTVWPHIPTPRCDSCSSVSLLAWKTFITGTSVNQRKMTKAVLSITHCSPAVCSLNTT